ncbi:transglycosylase SLT domain-containing protein [Streptomyces cacaoi]|uniref:transglycosylase SLT domain-containing protein n=1 Tax=Streptomyces cacaoi TaxID=1898 RepID=UPI003530896F
MPVLVAVLATSQPQAHALQDQADQAALLLAQEQARRQASRQAHHRKVAELRKTTERKAAETRQQKKGRASRPAAPHKRSAPGYPNNLDGWIRQALSIMRQHGIPGSYEGIRRNIIRESGGDPTAVNNWDTNARNGVPSKGLLQVIQPTFRAYHVPGTSGDVFDPVANIAAACNYAAHTYGSIDNVNGAY